jgi:protease-4
MASLPRRGRIAVLEIFGTIGNAVRPSVYVPLLEGVRKSRRIKALVLDVDSPGGGAPGSAELYAAVKRVAAEKPVVAYIRGMGASGAYYLSCPASRIVATPDALVGSIGVILLRPVLAELLRRLGIGMSVSKQGRLKDMFQPWRPPTDEEEQKIQALIDDTYDAFVQAVAQGRGMAEDRVRELATGEIFTGRQALPLGLVDVLGDMETALDAASELAGVPRRPLYIRPRRPFMRRMFHGMAAELTDAVVEELSTRLRGRLVA